MHTVDSSRRCFVEQYIIIAQSVCAKYYSLRAELTSAQPDVFCIMEKYHCAKLVAHHLTLLQKVAQASTYQISSFIKMETALLFPMSCPPNGIPQSWTSHPHDDKLVYLYA